MAASNLVPSITAAHADLFVPADRAISLPTGKFISLHQSCGAFINNRSNNSVQLEYSNAEVAAKNGHAMTICTDTKAKKKYDK